MFSFFGFSSKRRKKVSPLGLAVSRSRPPCWTFLLLPTCSSSFLCTKDWTWSRSSSRCAATWPPTRVLMLRLSPHVLFVLFTPPSAGDCGGAAHLRAPTGSSQSPCFQSPIGSTLVPQPGVQGPCSQDPYSGHWIRTPWRRWRRRRAAGPAAQFRAAGLGRFRRSDGQRCRPERPRPTRRWVLVCFSVWD